MILCDQNFCLRTVSGGQVLQFKPVHKKLVACQFKVVIDKHVNVFFLMNTKLFQCFSYIIISNHLLIVKISVFCTGCLNFKITSSLNVFYFEVYSCLFSLFDLLRKHTGAMNMLVKRHGHNMQSSCLTCKTF